MAWMVAPTFATTCSVSAGASGTSARTAAGCATVAKEEEQQEQRDEQAEHELERALKKPRAPFDPSLERVGDLRSQIARVEPLAKRREQREAVEKRVAPRRVEQFAQCRACANASSATSGRPCRRRGDADVTTTTAIAAASQGGERDAKRACSGAR